MSGEALFEWADFAPAAPAWAEGCFYCRPDPTGWYDEDLHLAGHLPLTCDICGEAAPNRLLFEMNHTVCLGASWEHDALMCTSLWLRLNHLSYALRAHTRPRPEDLTALQLGWRLAPDGAQIPPAGWPPAPARN